MEAPLNHIVYSYDDDKEAIELIKKVGYQENFDIFYDDLNRKSLFIEDNNGTTIQLIRK